MEEYLSVTQFSQLHGIDSGNIRKLIAVGRIPAVKIGSQWIIPKNTPRPVDLRVKNGKYVNWRKKEAPSE